MTKTTREILGIVRIIYLWWAEQVQPVLTTPLGLRVTSLVKGDVIGVVSFGVTKWLIQWLVPRLDREEKPVLQERRRREVGTSQQATRENNVTERNRREEKRRERWLLRIKGVTKKNYICGEKQPPPAALVSAVD